MTNQFGIKIKQLREDGGLLQKQVADQLNIDPPMLSKIEHGERKAKKGQVELLAVALNADGDELLTLWLADHLLNVIDGEQLGLKAITLASERMMERFTNKLTVANGL